MRNLQYLSSIFLILILIIGFTFSIPAQVFNSERVADVSELKGNLAALEEKIEKRRLELKIPGLSIAIIKNGQIIFLKGMGYRDFDRKQAVTPDTIFPIASATKAFTALSVLMLADEGKLLLEDNPKKHLSYFQINDSEINKNITIRNLLSHSSGLARTDLASRIGNLSRKELIEIAGQAKPTAPLGEKFQYQNIMFTAAGEIVARIHEQTWDKFISERIFVPLGMTNSTTTITEMLKKTNYSFGYDYNFETGQTIKLPFRETRPTAPAGAINSSARDMAKWLYFVMNEATVNGNRLISAKYFADWLKPQQKITSKISYGLGWYLQDWNGLKVVQHGGNLGGFNSLVAMIPEKKVGFVLLTNFPESSLGNELMPIIWENILGKPETANSVKDIKSSLTSGAIRELIGRYETSAVLTEADLRYKTPIEIKKIDSKIVLVVSGQRPLELQEKEKDVYRILPLPESYAVKVIRSALDKPESIVLVRPQGELPFTPVSGVEKKTGSISAEEIILKTIEALGGESNWKKSISREIKFEIDYENQGIKGIGTSYAKKPDLYFAETKLIALGKPVATINDYFDGTTGAQLSTFAATDVYTGIRLNEIKLERDFYGLLNWKKFAKSAEITGVAKVGSEDVFVLVFRPENAHEIIYYISQKSYLPVKKSSVIVSAKTDPKIPLITKYSDYRSVEGMMIPFKTEVSLPIEGNLAIYVKGIKSNTKISDTKFKIPKKLKF